MTQEERERIMRPGGENLGYVTGGQEWNPDEFVKAYELEQAVLAASDPADLGRVLRNNPAVYARVPARELFAHQ